MYSFEGRIRYSETDENGYISLDAIINYMQDCTNFESEDLGVGLNFLKHKHMMWILSSWQIVIRSYPKFGTKIKVGTQSYGYDKMVGYRNFLITDKDNRTVVVANSNWVLMDTMIGRPMIVPPEIGDVYGKYEPLIMDYAPRKIKLPKLGEAKAGFKVKEYHLDTNHHVNNGQYVKMAMLALGVERRAKEVRVEYKRQAVLGDTIIPVVYNERNQSFVALNGEDGKTYTIVQFIFRR